jgi:hypothetical protein
MTNPSLSVRDKRKLRRLVFSQVAQGKPDLEKLVYEFPCKNIEEIREVANPIFAKNLKRTL